MNLPSSSMKRPKPMPPASAPKTFHSLPSRARNRMMAMSMPRPPQSRWAKWILPPPSCGHPVAARMPRTRRIVAIADTKKISNWFVASTRRTKKERLGAAATGASDRSVIGSGGVGAQHLHPRQLAGEALERLIDGRIAAAALQVDEEDVVAEALFGGPRLHLRQVDVAVGELAEDEQQGARLVGADAADDAGLVAGVQILGRRGSREVDETRAVVDGYDRELGCAGGDGLHHFLDGGIREGGEVARRRVGKQGLFRERALRC